MFVFRDINYAIVQSLGGISMSELKNEYRVYETAKGWFEIIEKEDAEKCKYREVPDEEQKDISFLITIEYVSFFSAPTSEYEGTSTGYIGSWNYPEIMETFKDKILRAYRSLYNFRGYNGRKPVWAEMRDKYCNGRSYVHPDEMIEHLSEFDSREIIGFLYYCTIYKERFCDGVYGFYAKEGFIGRLLIRLKEILLPQ